MLTNRYRLFPLAGLATLLLLVTPLFAQDAGPVRPKITGISHVGYFVSDLPQAMAFWHDFLGFDESYSLTKKDSKDIRIAFIKINEDQYLELFAEPPKQDGHMNHISFSTDDANAMRLYLASGLLRTPVGKRWDVLHGLLTHAEDANDHNLPFMYWYAAEGSVGEIFKRLK